MNKIEFEITSRFHIKKEHATEGFVCIWIIECLRKKQLHNFPDETKILEWMCLNLTNGPQEALLAW